MNKDYDKGFKAGYERGWAACLEALGSKRRKALRRLVVVRPATGKKAVKS